MNDAEASDSPMRVGWQCTWLNTESLDVRITSITYPSRVLEQITGYLPVRKKLYDIEEIAEVLNVGRTRCSA